VAQIRAGTTFFLLATPQAGGTKEYVAARRDGLACALLFTSEALAWVAADARRDAEIVAFAAPYTNLEKLLRRDGLKWFLVNGATVMAAERFLDLARRGPADLEEK
jgi:hypothetical protein